MILGTKRNRPLKDSKYPAKASQSKTPSTNDLQSLNIGQSTKSTGLMSSTDSSAKSAKTFTKYRKMFVDDSLASRDNSRYTTPHPTPQQLYKQHISSDKECNDGMSAKSDEQSRRLSGGTQQQRQRVKLFLSPSQCKITPPGLEYFDPKKKFSVINLQLNDVEMRESFDNLMLPEPRRIGKHKTRATQTLYRESSAQTLPYLPGVSNNAEELETLEIFKLPTILPGDGPPGIYEVEVLERARRRWAFAEALKENFRKQLETAKEQVKVQDHEHILEAFEWEHWIEREENIQECQMLRLELLIRMFDKREREMHIASKSRIQKSCEEIEAKRKASLKKNDIEFNRALRRLEIKHAKQSRVWHKEDITKELGDPSSEFYAPKMRYGVNPNRRNFSASHKGFDMRMDNLEKKAIKMDPKNLKCPFAKLREWSKPKEVLQEVEQNFCSDANLHKLYNSLRTLREISRKQKYVPTCLKAKQPADMDKIKKDDTHKRIPDIISTEKSADRSDNSAVSLTVSVDSTLEGSDRDEYFEELRKEKQAERFNREMLQEEMRCEELETLINSYEGNTIGWLMRFLSEEMSRLKEQRKLQLFSMMAKRKRWHREAAEAGLRQKENCMREVYEKLYKKCDQINQEITDRFLNSMLSSDIKDYAHQTAEKEVLDRAKEIDKEITGWLESFAAVQNPLNYHTLRHALKDIVIPDAEKKIYRLERDDCIDYIINDVLMAKVYRDLESYEVSLDITNEFLARLLDDDLYMFSSDCDIDCECLKYECVDVCCCPVGKKEAKSVIRKLIRQAVPGRRWHTLEERIALENIRDFLDEIFEQITTIEFINVDTKKQKRVHIDGAHTDLVSSKHDIIFDVLLEDPISLESCDTVKVKDFDSQNQYPIVDITKSLRFNEELLLGDPDKITGADLLIREDKYIQPTIKRILSRVRIIPSTHDLSQLIDFSETPIFAPTSSENSLSDEELSLEEITPELRFEMSSEIIDETSYESDQEIEEMEEQEKEKEKEKETETETEEIHEIEAEKTTTQEESEEEEDSGSGLMKVAFLYDPDVQFSVPKPSAHDMDEEHSQTSSK